MTDDREKLIEEMAQAIANSEHVDWRSWVPEAKAALSVAEKGIREELAQAFEKLHDGWTAKDIAYVLRNFEVKGHD